MARPLRLEFLGAVWHVTCRGNERKRIFRDEEDRVAFLATLGRVVTMFRWKLHAYVLMGNHFHLLFETPEPSLSRGMRQLNGIYTQRFNRRHGRSGHLLQGRFRGILVEKESHLLELARYVVLNPVRAGLVRTPRAWPWSSYGATAGFAAAPEWLETASTLDQFGRTRRAGQAGYRTFVAEGMASGYAPWKAVTGQLVLGSETFARQIGRIGRQRTPSPEVPKRQWAIGRPGIEEILAAVGKVFDTKAEAIRRPRGGVAREAVAFLARREGAWSIAEIATALGVRSWSASHLASFGERRTETDRTFRQKIESVVMLLRTQTT
ncbi:MAG TPA: transposase [Thermoanaerobaculia bacterium]|nr:transposase [Thermoanaerobaculia bacterium]HQR66340.1 transposase [Thermoanaerobaculia bacterium]